MTEDLNEVVLFTVALEICHSQMHLKLMFFSKRSSRLCDPNHLQKVFCLVNPAFKFVSPGDLAKLI